MSLVAGDTPRGESSGLSRHWRSILAALLALAFVIPIAFVLAKTVYGTIEVPLATPSQGWQPLPVDMPLSPSGSGGIEHRLRLSTRNVGRFAAHSEIRLLVATHRTAPELERAELSIAGTECTYRTERGAQFPDNGKLRLVRDRTCVPLRGAPTGELQLTLRFRIGGRPAIWTFVAPPGSEVGDALIVEEPSAQRFGGRPVVRGMLADEYRASRARRVELLAYVWQIAPSATWIWAAVLICGSLLGLGVYALLQSPASASALVYPPGAFVAALALSMTYAVLVPPLHAPDEPTHVMGFANAVGWDIGEELARLASVGHFRRIQFDPEEHFRPSDAGRPGEPWHGEPPSAPTRGGAVEWLWSAVAPVLSGLPLSQVLLALRLTNAVIFALSVAIFMAVIAKWSGASWPPLLAFPLYLVPTLPFFGMHVSNYAPLVGSYIILAAGSLLLFLDRTPSHVAGLLLGIGWSSALLISRSALPLVPFIAALLVGRLILSGRDQRFRSTLLFWGGFIIPLFIALVMASPMYRLILFSVVPDRSLPPPIAGAIAYARTRPILLIALILIAPMLERLLLNVRCRVVGPTMREWSLRIAAGAAAVGAVAAFLLVAGSLFTELPTLPIFDSAHPPRPLDYARDVVAAGLTMFRFGPPDRMTSITFWGGFGWLETSPPSWLISMLAGTTGVSLVVVLIWLSRSRNVRSTLWLCVTLTGYGASLGAYAYAIMTETPTNVHGRYLLGLYLSVLTIIWSPLALQAGRRAISSVVACAAACVFIHVYCLTVILERYF